MREEDIRAFYADPRVMVASDGEIDGAPAACCGICADRSADQSSSAAPNIGFPPRDV